MDWFRYWFEYFLFILFRIWRVKEKPETEALNPAEWPENDVILKEIFKEITLQLGPPDIDFLAGLRTFRVHKFRVHKKILEKHSSVIKAKLSDIWKTSSDVLQLNEEYVEPEVIEELLTWMYYMNAGKDRKCSAENAYSLCVAAHYLMITELVTSCCDKLGENLTLDNFHDIFTLSKHLNISLLRRKCEQWVSSSDFRPSDFFPNPEVVKYDVEELTLFIWKSLKVENSPGVCDMIFLSLAVGAEASIKDRFRDAESLLENISPAKLSSDALFRFMETELYSRLNESHRKQYSVHSETKEWKALKDMQTEQLKNPSVVLDGLVYAIGGETHCQVSRPERYDLLTNRWEYIAPSSYSYHHEVPAVVAHVKQIFVLSRTGFEVYSPHTDRWTRLPAPEVCIKPSLVSIAKRLLLISDSVSSSTQKASRLVYEFDVIGRKWSRIPDLPALD